MKLRYRLIFLVLFLFLLLLIGYLITGNFSFVINDFWFASGLLLLLLISLIDQPFFSTNANIFMNGTAGMSLILVDPIDRDFWWHLFLFWCIWLIISSYIIMWFKENRPEYQKRGRELLSKINREIGKPEAIFSAFFLWSAIKQFGVEAGFQPLFAFWAVFIVFNVPSISRAIDHVLDIALNKDTMITDIGTLYKIADPRVVEIKVNRNCPNEILGLSIESYSKDNHLLSKAIVIDDRVVAGNRIVKIALTEINSEWNYVSQKPDEVKFHINFDDQENYDIPISVIDVESSIDFVKFYLHPDFEVRKGEIVWTSVAEKKVYYQITQAFVVESISADGNTIKNVQVIANQLGVWNDSKLRFEQFSWIPPAGNLVFLGNKDNELESDIPDDEVMVGKIPNSSFPVLANISELVTHNTAIIGVTGSGKSYLAFHLIESIINNGIQVLILDLTREYYLYFQDLKPTKLHTHTEINEWFEKKESLIGIYQFANSTGYPKTTKEFVETAFSLLKDQKLEPGTNIPARLCIVFEEAHSLIPEWNQVAQQSDKEYVNATARTILQGRKFGLGSLLITQRTANVTKTILNQCNTMIALRSFDQTGLDFLSNYMGTQYSQAISTLPTRDAILVGKASSCQTPVIFSIPDFSDRWKGEDEEHPSP
ncbi:MAG: DUF87 domain-containing protein [Anaerolineaceae bacterium]|nr:DUF87 domain-containing protein [Anaerolineaceae bacterium]